jgi:hypothetical protein
VLLTDRADRVEIRELATESYRLLAPKKLGALLDWRRRTPRPAQRPLKCGSRFSPNAARASMVSAVPKFTAWERDSSSSAWSIDRP